MLLELAARRRSGTRTPVASRPGAARAWCARPRSGGRRSSASTRLRTVDLPAPEGPGRPRSGSAGAPTQRSAPARGPARSRLERDHLLHQRRGDGLAADACWPPAPAPGPGSPAACPQGPSAASSPRAWATWLRRRWSSSATSWRSTSAHHLLVQPRLVQAQLLAQLARTFSSERLAPLRLPRLRQPLDARGRRLHRVERRARGRPRGARPPPRASRPARQRLLERRPAGRAAALSSRLVGLQHLQRAREARHVRHARPRPPGRARPASRAGRARGRDDRAGRAPPPRPPRPAEGAPAPRPRPCPRLHAPLHQPPAPPAPAPAGAAAGARPGRGSGGSGCAR